jgi:hypothetical protein
MGWRSALAAPLPAVVLLLAGCQDSPTASSMQVAQARAQGERDVASVRREATEQYLRASADVEAARARARIAAVEGEREIALAQARADFEVGIKGCDALGGVARDACRNKIENRHQAAIDAARQIQYAGTD